MPCPAVTLRSAFPLSNIALARGDITTMNNRKALTLLDHLGKTGYLVTFCAVVIASLAVGAFISLLVTAARVPTAPISPHAAQFVRTSSADPPASWQSDASPL